MPYYPPVAPPSGGTVIGTGTAGKSTRFIASDTIADGAMVDDGTDVLFAGNILMTPGTAIGDPNAIGLFGGLSVQGELQVPAGGPVKLGAAATDAKITSGPLAPSASAAAGSIYLRQDAGFGSLYVNTSNPSPGTTWTALSTGGAVTPSVVASVGAAYTSLNLSTHGTIDWYFPVDTTSAHGVAPPVGAVPSLLNSKKFGGWIANSFRWMNTTAGLVAHTEFVAPTMSSDASDNVAGSALSSSLKTGVESNVATVGCVFRVPAGTTPRSLNFYEIGASTLSGSVSITITAKLRDAGTTHSATATGLAALQKIYSVVFNSSVPGDELIVTVTVTDTGGGATATRIKCKGISLGV